jgi:hypothetical protein
VSNGQGRHKTGQCSDDTANGKHCSSRLLRRRAAGEFKASEAAARASQSCAAPLQMVIFVAVSSEWR